MIELIQHLSLQEIQAKNKESVIKLININENAKQGKRKETILLNKYTFYTFSYNNVKQNYYDKYPVIYPTNYDSSFIYGICLHYMDYISRKQFMACLENLSSFSSMAKLKTILLNSSRYIRRYDINNFSITPIPIKKENWVDIYTLPVVK